VGKLAEMMGTTAGSPPNCGNGNGGSGQNNGGGGGGGGTPVPAPEGNCESADLVLLTRDAKIVCLFADGTQATKEEECPDALIATGPIAPLGLGACVFLPPAAD
jgi:hypothetical protein